MRSDVCPFCGNHPYEYVDIGVGSVPCAVTCCELGDLYFRGARPDPVTVEIEYQEFCEIGGKLPVWFDIDGAPHDGTDILTWDGNSMAVLFWSKYGNGWTCGNPKITHNPSRWMPLPTPPEET